MTRKTPEERAAILAGAIAQAAAEGKRVESQGDSQVTVVRGKRPNNVFHIIMTVLTAGVWFFLVWIWILIFGGEKRWLLTVDDFGNIREQKV